MEVLKRSDLTQPITISSTGFNTDARSFKTLNLIDETVLNKDWEKKQSDALSEYQDTHEEENISNESQLLYTMFEWFATHAIKTRLQTEPDDLALVLDVGCGIGTKIPPYVRDLSKVIRYVGLDPFETNMERNYPFICSTVEQMKLVRDRIPAFDAFLFATSLDHFQDIKSAADCIHSIAKPGSLAIFWVGLHDVSIVSTNIGANVFQNVFSNPSPLSQSIKFYWWAFGRFPIFLRIMAKRKSSLKNGTPLDKYHFHYFENDRLDDALSNFGEIENKVIIPGTNSCFVSCRIT